jgi:uncharacterized protein DUF4154
MQRTSAAWSGRIVFAVIAALLAGAPAFSQDVTEPSLKAAYIYNLVKFTEWPEPVPPSTSFVMCVMGDPAVGDALERAVKGRALAGTSISVVRLTSTGQQRACHVLYVSGVMAGQASQIVAGLGDAPVLTISDLEGFTDVGGMVQFFFEHGQLRFSVGMDSVKRAHLQISAKVLSLAIRK